MAIRKVLECRDLEKLIKKLEPYKVGDIVSVQNWTGNYDVFLYSFEEINVMRISILKRSHYDGQSVPKEGARWYLLMLFFLLLYDGSKIVASSKGRSENSHIVYFKIKVAENRRIVSFKMKVGEIIASRLISREQLWLFRKFVTSCFLASRH